MKHHFLGLSLDIHILREEESEKDNTNIYSYLTDDVLFAIACG